ncbi:hypothetical protein ACTJKN_25750 [Pedobacter sp. 22163]|uniref:hypothetical protein n=1 Tax=Pedobacter sp. 22163 TaxID=3453883 RepID=UPI003F8794DE
MSQLKAGKHCEFAEIISDDQKFLKLFSTSHIGDIAASDQSEHNRANIESDLEFIQEITNGWCVYISSNKAVFEKRSALELYDDRTELKDIQKVFEPGGLKKMLEDLDLDDQTTEKITPFIQALENLPTAEVFRETFENPQTSETMRQFLPGLESDNSQMGIFNSFLSMFSRLNETEDYKKLRLNLQKGINLNRDRLFDAKEPYKLIEKAYQKFNIEVPSDGADSNHAPQWYNELCNEYIRLDMHGYQEDKITVEKGRKQTFRNTVEDAFHTAFATTCDFYITNDDRNLKKSEAVYQKLQINSLVMKPNEFVAHYNDWLHLKANQSIRLIAGVLKHVDPVVSEDGKKQSYFGCFFIFDYFNKIYQLEDDALYLILSREKPTNARMVFEKELSVLIDKMLDVFGEDNEKLGGFQSHEIAMAREDKWLGRKWIHDGLYFNLLLLNGHLQLYITAREFRQSIL